MTFILVHRSDKLRKEFTGRITRLAIPCPGGGGVLLSESADAVAELFGNGRAARQLRQDSGDELEFAQFAQERSVLGLGDIDSICSRKREIIGAGFAESDAAVGSGH
jgi:hypothetical protein